MTCKSHLRIEGSKEDIERFVLQAGDENYFLSGFIPLPLVYGQWTPYPLYLEDDDREASALLTLKYGADNPYDWCLANWGTQYDEVDSSYDEQAHSFNFTTSAPPVIAIIRISLLYPGLKIFYEYKADEEDIGKVFGKWGKYIIQDGWIEHEEYEKQNKGELARWIGHIRERDKELRECLQKVDRKHSAIVKTS